MSWHAPRTWRPGDVARNLTARVLNAELRDNLLYLYNTLTGSGTPWTAVATFTNSWSNLAGNAPAGYRKDGDWVTLRGTITGGTTGTSVGAAFVVPAGYEPLYDMRYPVIDGSGGPAGYVRVRTTGSVVVVAGNNALIDLAPIRWAIT
jgi:hypothetical protein